MSLTWSIKTHITTIKPAFGKSTDSLSRLVSIPQYRLGTRGNRIGTLQKNKGHISNQQILFIKTKYSIEPQANNMLSLPREWRQKLSILMTTMLLTSNSTLPYSLSKGLFHSTIVNRNAFLPGLKHFDKFIIPLFLWSWGLVEMMRLWNAGMNLFLRGLGMR